MKNGYMPAAGNSRLPTLVGNPALGEASADDLRVLIYLAEQDYRCGVEEIAHGLGITLTRAAAGLEHWLQAGVITEGATAASVSPVVDDSLILGTAAEDAREIAERRLKGCLDTCSEILGKLLNPAEINLLVGVITNYGVSDSYLVTLLDFCVNRLEVRGVKYTVKVAGTLFEEGIRTDAALDAYIRRYESVHSNEGQVRRLFGIGERSLTKREREILGRWFSDYGYDMEIVGIAYDITVATATRVGLAYADKILTKWHEAGLKTLSEVEAYLEKERATRATTPAPAPKRGGKKTSAPTGTAASFDVGNFFESALARSYGTGDKKEDKGD